MDVPFFWVDVFAERPLTGNPLSLVPDADALDEETMRAIAREFNQSETTFLVEPADERADVRLRSFTPDGSEVFGAGHNAMGAWLWLAASGRLRAGAAFVQQIGDDLLPVRVGRDPGGRVRVSMDQSPAEFTRRLEHSGALAAALGAPTDVLGDDAPEVGSTGAAHLLVPLVSAEAVDAVRPDPGALAAVLAEAGAEGCYVYTTAVPDGPTAAYARFFNPTVGIAEDAATGTAAGPLAALLVRQGLAPGGDPVVIEQGRALGRPSRIAVTVEDGRVTITGAGVLTGSGVLHLDG